MSRVFLLALSVSFCFVLEGYSQDGDCSPPDLCFGDGRQEVTITDSVGTASPGDTIDATAEIEAFGDATDNITYGVLGTGRGVLAVEEMPSFGSGTIEITTVLPDTVVMGTGIFFRAVATASEEIARDAYDPEGDRTVQIGRVEGGLAVSSIRPESGAPGTQVRVYGTRFSPMADSNAVTLGGVNASIDSVGADTSALYVRVPSGPSGPVGVSVTTGEATGEAADRFSVVTGGEASFASIDASLTSVETSSSDWGDYDGDGDLDLVVAGENDEGTATATIYENNVANGGGFQPLGAGLDGVQGRPSVAWGDYDGDGDLDLVVTGGDDTGTPTTTIYENDVSNGNGFQSRNFGVQGVKGGSADWGDFDGDGDLDLAVTGFDGSGASVEIYENDVANDNGFQSEYSLEGVIGSSADWGDFDGDGDLDLAVTGNTISTRKSKIYENDVENGNGFSAIGANIVDVNRGTPAWEDYDGDGDLDLLITGRDGDGNAVAKVYENTGAGPDRFSSLDAGIEGRTKSREAAAWGDFDGDGYPDFVIAGEDSSGTPASTIYENKTDQGGGFAPLDVGLEGVVFGSASWGDYDSDGDLDIVLTGRNSNGNGTTSIYENGGEGQVEGDILRVDANVSSPGEGETWDSAYQHLQSALAKADTTASISEIWVAAGSYYPDGSDAVANGRRDTSFVLLDSLGIYGGFAGGEQERSARNPDANATVLSGNIGGDGQGDNSYHVVSAQDVSPGAALDGFTVRDGNADQLGVNGRGAGLLLDRASPSLRNLVVRGNEALGAGGGLANISTDESTAGEPSLRDVQFFLNSGLLGGGVSMSDGGAVELRNVSFRGNDGEDGGALYVEGSSSLDFAGGLVTGNEAKRGGGIALAGAGSVQLTNVTLSGNSATAEGGGIFYRNGTTLDLANSIVWNNAAPMDESVSFDGSGTVSIRHGIIEGGPPSGVSDLTEVFNTDPEFVELADPVEAPTTAGDFRLLEQSIAINEGINSALPENLSTDLEGGPRIENDTVDLGPHEGSVQQQDLRVPRELAAAGGDSQVSLNWRPPQDPPPSFSEGDLVAYRIYRETEPIEGETSEFDYIESVPVTDTSFVDDGAENFQQYYYRVTAFYEGEENDLGITPTTETGFSNQATATPERPPEDPPPAPANFEAAAKANKISLSWSPVGSIDQYVLFRGTSSDSLSEYQSVNGDSSNFEDQDVSIGTTYYYQVKAIDTEGDESPRSSKDSAAPLEESITPLTVGGLTFQNVEEAVLVSEDPNVYRLSGGTEACDGLVRFQGDVMIDEGENPTTVMGDGKAQLQTDIPGLSDDLLTVRDQSFEASIQQGKINFAGDSFIDGALSSIGYSLPITFRELDCSVEGGGINAPSGFKLPGFFSQLTSNFLVPEVNSFRISSEGIEELDADVNLGANIGNNFLEANGSIGVEYNKSEEKINALVSATLDGGRVAETFLPGAVSFKIGVVNSFPYIDLIRLFIDTEVVPIGSQPVVGISGAGAKLEDIASNDAPTVEGQTTLVPVADKVPGPLKASEVIRVDPVELGDAPSQYVSGDCATRIGQVNLEVCGGGTLVMLFQEIGGFGAELDLDDASFLAGGSYNIPGGDPDDAVFNGQFDVNASIEGSVLGGNATFNFSGGASNTIQIPKGDGFFFDTISTAIASSTGRGPLPGEKDPLPYPITEREVAWWESGGGAQTGLFGVDFVAALVSNGNGLSPKFVVDGDLDNLMPKTQRLALASTSKAISMSQSSTTEDISSESNVSPPVSIAKSSPWVQAKKDSLRQKFILDQPASQMIVEVQHPSKEEAPEVPLSLPDGTTIDPEASGPQPDDSQVVFYPNDAKGTSYYIVKSPSLGQYAVTVPSQEYEIRVVESPRSPSVQLELDQVSGNTAELQWEGRALTENADIDLFYDRNAYGQDGTVIKAGIPATEQSTYSWDLSDVPTGEYYIYARVQEGQQVPEFSYAADSVRVVASDAPASPSNLQGETVGSAINLQWTAPADSLAYMVHAVREGEPSLEDDIMVVEDTTRVRIGPDELDPGRTYRIAVSALGNGEQSLPSETIEVDFISPLLNNAPTIQSDASVRQVFIGETYTLDAQGSDPDGDPISYALPSSPPGMTIGSGGVLQWTPSEDQVGVYQVQIAATDPGGPETQSRGDTLSFQIAATPKEQARASINVGQTFYRGSDEMLSVTVRDSDINEDATSVETVTVTVRSEATPSGTEVTATETGPDTGVFTSTVGIGGGPDALEVNSPRDTLRAEYEDPFPSPRESDETRNGNRLVQTRAFYTTDTTPPSFPDTLSVRPGKKSIKLNWSPPSDENILSYRVYRGRNTGDLTQVATLSSDSLALTDSTVKEGTEYIYRLSTVDNSGLESDLSGRVSAKTQPSEVQISVERSLGSSPGPQSYRLMALPGQVNLPLEQTLSGEAGTEWQAYWDDGSEEDFLVRYDGSETFNFRPGRGFWATSKQGWTVESAIQTVPLDPNANASIPLHDGWNIISNPLSAGVSWRDVVRVNGGDISPLWTFDGNFSRADSFRTARSGEAYYFLNDQSLDSLQVPYLSRTPQQKRTAPAAGEKNVPTLALSARPKDSSSATGSTVRVGIDENANSGLGLRDLVAPPGRFELVSLRIKAPDTVESNRRRFLMTEVRPPAEVSEGGHTFDLQLTVQGTTPAQISASNLQAIQGLSVALLDPSSGQAYDLHADSAVVVEVDESKGLRLSVGSERYVENQREKVLPDEVNLTSYPNPIGRQGTIEYTLPEQKEVTLQVYDVLGRRVATLAKGRKEAGRHQVQLDAGRLASGVYFGRLQAGDETRTQKIVVVR